MAQQQSIGLGFNLDNTSSKEIKLLGKYMEESNKKLEEFLRVSSDILKSAAKGEFNDPYSKIVAEELQKRSAQKADMDYYKDLYGNNKIAITAWNEAEKRKITNSSLSDTEKAYQYDSLGELYDQRLTDLNTVSQIAQGEEIGKIMSKTLDNMILDFDNFDKHMRNMSNQLLSYLLNQTMETLLKGLGSFGGDKSIFSLLTGASNKGGGLGGLANIGLGFGKALGLFHSGGVVPLAASYSLPGTQEQLAILKGGERVLSPGENVQYEKDSGASQVVFNNFNVKAWDSKDVQKYLLENQNLLNGITARGIKDNNQHLRHMVRNA